MNQESIWKEVIQLLSKQSPNAGTRLTELLVNAKEERLTLLTKTLEFLSKDGNERIYVYGICTFIQSIMKLMIHSYQLSHDAVCDMVNFVIVEVRHFSSPSLVKNVSYCLEFMSQNKEADLPVRWIEMFGKMVAVLATRGEIESNGEIVSGMAYKVEVISAICRIEWGQHNGASLIAALREIPGIDADDVKLILEKAGPFIRNLEPPSVPPMAYQLLLLAGSTFPSAIIANFDEYFSGIDYEAEDDAEELSTSTNKKKALGTTVYHFVQRSRQSEALLKELVKRIKASQFHHSLVVSPFMISVAVGLTRIDSVKPVIIESVKTTILKWYMEIHLSKSLRWYFDCSGRVPSDSVTSCFARAIDSRTSELDFMLDGLKELGIGLLNTEISGAKEIQWAKKQCTIVGDNLLTSMVSKEKDYLPVLINEFLKNQNSATNIECLGHCLRKVVSPFIRKKFVGRITELIHHLPLMKVETAIPVLKAILPALQLSQDLLGEVIMVLRKTIWKSVEARRISVAAMVLLLSNSKIVGEIPRSQYSCSQSQSQDFLSSQVPDSQTNILGSFNKNESICFEVLGILKRFFMQQVEVRVYLYIGLYNVARQNPELISFLCSHVHSQIRTHLPTSGQIRIQFDKIVQFSNGQLVIMEPIGFLIQCASFLVTKSRHIYAREGDFSDETPSSVLGCEEVMRGLVESMRFVTNADLDKLSAHILPQGQSVEVSYQAKAELGVLVLQMIEALIEYLCLGGKGSDPSDLNLLLKKFRDIFDLLKPPPPSKKDKKGSSKSKKLKDKANTSDSTLQLSGDTTTGDFLPPKSKDAPTKKIVYVHITAIEHISLIFQKLYNATGADPNNLIKNVDNTFEFEMYLFGIVKQKINCLKHKEPLKEREKNVQALNAHLAKIAHYLWIEASGTPHSLEAGNKELTMVETRAVDEDELRLEVAAEILEYLFINFASDRRDLLCHFLNQTVQEQSYNDLFGNFFEEFSKHMDCARKYPCRDANKSTKALTFIFKILELVSLDLTTESSVELVAVLEWFSNFLKADTNEIFDETVKPLPSLAEIILAAFISISSKMEAVPESFIPFAKKVQDLLENSLEESEPPTESQDLWLITADTVHIVLHQFSFYIESTLGVIKDIIGRMNCIYVEEEKAASWRNNCCTLMYFLMRMLSHFVQSKFNVGPWVDVLRRTAVLFFNIMTSLTESFVTLHTKSTIGFRSRPFEILVNAVGSEFKIYAESMIHHIEEIRRKAYEDEAGNKKRSTTAKSNISKDTKTIPALVYSIERYEQQLIALSQKTKVNFLAGMRLAAPRDFRIKYK